MPREAFELISNLNLGISNLPNVSNLKDIEPLPYPPWGPSSVGFHAGPETVWPPDIIDFATTICNTYLWDPPVGPLTPFRIIDCDRTLCLNKLLAPWKVCFVDFPLFSGQLFLICKYKVEVDLGLSWSGPKARPKTFTTD